MGDAGAAARWRRPAARSRTRSAATSARGGAWTASSGSTTTSGSSTRCSTSAGVSRAVLCGVSFGGFVALRYAALQPERVSGADPRVGARTGLAAEPAAGALDRPSVVVGARVRADVAAAGVAGSQRRDAGGAEPARGSSRGRVCAALTAPMIPSLMAVEDPERGAAGFRGRLPRVRGADAGAHRRRSARSGRSGRVDPRLRLADSGRRVPDDAADRPHGPADAADRSSPTS